MSRWQKMRLGAGCLAVALAGCVYQPGPAPVAYAPAPVVVREPRVVVVQRPAPPQVIVVQRPPPPPIIVERQPPPPPQHPYWVWQRGHWFWNGGRWVWQPGHYAQRLG